MKKYIITSILCFSLLAGAEETNSIQLVEGSGSGYKFVTVSLKDLSRIHCANSISNVFYSKEKEIEIKTVEKDAYIKILPRKTTGGNSGNEDKLDYGSHPREMYIECSGQTFSLVLVPKDIPAQTIVLKSLLANTAKASEFEKANPYEKTILELVKKGFLEEIPSGYEGRHSGKLIKNFNEIDLILSKQYFGAKYIVEEYTITAKEKIDIYEGMLIPYLKNPLAISIMKMPLAKQETTRMIVVRLNKTEE